MQELMSPHGDFDHISGAINVIENIKVKKVIFNNDQFNDLELEVIKLSVKKNIKYYRSSKNINIDNKIMISFYQLMFVLFSFIKSLSQS